MSGCRKCHHLSYVNQHKLDTANKLRISYQAPEVIGTLSYPRRYTIGTDDYEEFVVSIGTEYHPERHKYIIHGEWLIKESPEILFVFALDAGSAAQVNFFNVVTCNRVSLVLEAVAFAEIALLARYPRLQATPILIAFVCSDEDLQRRETWNTLGDWLPTTFEQKRRSLCICS